MLWRSGAPVPGAVEGGEDALAGVLYQAAAARLDVRRVAALNPGCELWRTRCPTGRGDSGGDEDSGEHAVEVGRVPCAGEEVLDLPEQRVEIAAAGELYRVVAGLFEITGSGMWSARYWP